MKFIIEMDNGLYYHRNKGKGDWSSSKALATVFNNLSDAQKIVDNQVAKSERKKCKITSLELNTKEVKNIIPGKSNQEKGKKIKKVKRVEMSTDVNLDKLKNIESTINRVCDEYSTNLENRRTILNKQLSDADLEVQDFLHYIEFSKLDVVTAYKIYKNLKNVLCKRRKIKNELEVVSDMCKFNIKDIVNNKFTESTQKLKNRKYNPRILGDLFE